MSRPGVQLRLPERDIRHADEPVERKLQVRRRLRLPGGRARLPLPQVSESAQARDACSRANAPTLP